MYSQDDLDDGFDKDRVRVVKLGCRVTSKRTGLPATGEVCGVLMPRLYLGMMNKTMEDHVVWEENYPDWASKIIVVVELDQPQKPCSLEEMRSWYPDKSEADIQVAYSNVPNTMCAMYPVDDLEVL